MPKLRSHSLAACCGVSTGSLAPRLSIYRGVGTSYDGRQATNVANIMDPCTGKILWEAQLQSIQACTDQDEVVAQSLVLAELHIGSRRLHTHAGAARGRSSAPAGAAAVPRDTRGSRHGNCKQTCVLREVFTKALSVGPNGNGNVCDQQHKACD